MIYETLTSELEEGGEGTPEVEEKEAGEGEEGTPEAPKTDDEL